MQPPLGNDQNEKYWAVWTPWKIHKSYLVTDEKHNKIINYLHMVQEFTRTCIENEISLKEVLISFYQDTQ